MERFVALDVSTAAGLAVKMRLTLSQFSEDIGVEGFIALDEPMPNDMLTKDWRYLSALERDRRR